MLEQNPNDLDVRAELGDLLVDGKGAGSRGSRVWGDKKEGAEEPGGICEARHAFRQSRKARSGGGRIRSRLSSSPPIRPQLLSSLVQVRLAQKKYDAAASLCENRIKRNGNDAIAYNLLGQAYGAAKDFKKAEGALNKAIELQPAWMAPLADLAQLYVMQGQTGAAIARLDDALKKKPENMTICLLLGQLYHKSKEYAKATEMYEKVLEQAAGQLGRGERSGLYPCRAGQISGRQLDRARDLAQKALNARPNEPSIQDTLGWVYYKQGDMNRASDFIEKAYAKMANSPAVNYHMGMVSYKAGKLAEAKDYLTKAVKSGETFDGKEEAQGTLGKL